MKDKKAPKTKGQKMADEARRLTNQATDAERERLMGVGMSLIYAAGQDKARVNRR